MRGFLCTKGFQQTSSISVIASLREGFQRDDCCSFIVVKELSNFYFIVINQILFVRYLLRTKLKTWELDFVTGLHGLDTKM